jgi:hypothetical protein
MEQEISKKMSTTLELMFDALDAMEDKEDVGCAFGMVQYASNDSEMNDLFVKIVTLQNELLRGPDLEVHQHDPAIQQKIKMLKDYYYQFDKRCHSQGIRYDVCIKFRRNGKDEKYIVDTTKRMLVSIPDDTNILETYVQP